MTSLSLLSPAFVLLAGAASASDTLCFALTDTALYADAGLSEEIRPIFQFDGAQFVPWSREGDHMFGMAFDVRMDPMLEEASFVRAGDWQCETLQNTDAAADGAGHDGTEYDVSAAACGQELSDTRINISAAGISFYESSCDIAAEEAGADDARILSLQCYGEGSEWPAKATLTPQAGGGILMRIDDYSQTYLPCE